MGEPPKPPALAGLARPSGPVFLREMNRKTDWGSDESPPDERVSDIIDLVFNRKTYPYSVYLVRTDEELRRVIIGMNGGRESLTAESHFIAIRAEELDAAGIGHDHTPGEGITRCHFANSLHHDLTAENDQFKALCLALIAAVRKAATFTKGRTRAIVPEAEALGCLAVPEATSCRHERCASPV